MHHVSLITSTHLWVLYTHELHVPECLSKPDLNHAVISEWGKSEQGATFQGIFGKSVLVVVHELFLQFPMVAVVFTSININVKEIANKFKEIKSWTTWFAISYWSSPLRIYLGSWGLRYFSTSQFWSWDILKCINALPLFGLHKWVDVMFLILL